MSGIITAIFALVINDLFKLLEKKLIKDYDI